MLRIHREADANGRTILRLEGSLLAPWVAELVRALDTAAPDSLLIDVASLAYADSKGARLLRDIASRVELRGCSPFLRELLRGSGNS